MTEEFETLVIDCGSYDTRVGYGDDTLPLSTFRSVVGVHKHAFMGVGMMMKDRYVGNEAILKKGILNFHFPMSTDRTPLNCDKYEQLFHHAYYNELRRAPEEHSVLLTDLCQMEGVFDVKKYDPMKTQFETFNVESLLMFDSSALSLYATGNTTGCVLEVGHGHSKSVTVLDGKPIHSSKVVLEDQQAPRRKRISGHLLTDFMHKCLGFENEGFGTKRLVENIKEKFCQVTLSPNKIRNFSKFQEGMKLNNNNKNDDINEHELPDGTKVKIGDERFLIPEILFQPSILGKGVYELPGIQNLIELSIEKSKVGELEKDEIWENIVTFGGTTLIPNFCERLELELRNSPNSRGKIEINKNNDRKNLSWIGGSVVSRLSSFKDCFLTRDEYDDWGWENGYKKKQIYSIPKTNQENKLFFGDTKRSRSNLISLDEDLEERMIYVIEKVLLVVVVDGKKKKNNFEIRLRFSSFLKLRFKSILLI